MCSTMACTLPQLSSNRWPAHVRAIKQMRWRGGKQWFCVTLLWKPWFCAPLSSPLLIECCWLPRLLPVSLCTCIKHRPIEGVIKEPAANMPIIISNKYVEQDPGKLNWTELTRSTYRSERVRSELRSQDGCGRDKEWNRQIQIWFVRLDELNGVILNLASVNSPSLDVGKNHSLSARGHTMQYSKPNIRMIKSFHLTRFINCIVNHL